MLNLIRQGEAGEVLVQVDHGDHPGGPLDHGDIELEEPEKGHAFDEMWGITKRG